MCPLALHLHNDLRATHKSIDRTYSTGRYANMPRQFRSKHDHCRAFTQHSSSQTQLQSDCFDRSTIDVVDNGRNRRSRSVDVRSVSLLESTDRASDSLVESSLTQLIAQTDRVTNTAVEQQQQQQQITLPHRIDHLNDEINSCAQRQSQLDRVVDQLINTIRRTSKDNLDQILACWAHFQRVSLEQIDHASCRRRRRRPYLFEYFFPSASRTTSLPMSIEQSDDVNAAYQVLVTALIIVTNDNPSMQVDRLYDEVRANTLDNLQFRLDRLLSSYVDEHQLIKERIHFYRSQTTNNHTEQINVNSWMEIVRTDYSPLIEKLASDFTEKIPSIEQTLVRMLINLRSSLLRFHGDTHQRR
jgi:hypothetical protein